MKRSELVAWAAGFIEGEGNIAALRGRQGHGEQRWKIRIQVPQYVAKPLYRLQGLFGGRVGQYRTVDGGRQYLWYIDSTSAANALKEMRPYMSFTQEQATLAIMIQNSIDLWGRRSRQGIKRGAPRIPQEVWDKRERWARRLQDLHLNKRTKNYRRAGVEIESDSPGTPPVSDDPNSVDNTERPAEMTGPGHVAE